MAGHFPLILDMSRPKHWALCWDRQTGLPCWILSSQRVFIGRKGHNCPARKRETFLGGNWALYCKALNTYVHLPWHENSACRSSSQKVGNLSGQRWKIGKLWYKHVMAGYTLIKNCVLKECLSKWEHAHSNIPQVKKGRVQNCMYHQYRPIGSWEEADVQYSTPAPPNSVATGHAISEHLKSLASATEGLNFEFKWI